MIAIDDDWTGGQYSLARIASAAVLVTWASARGAAGLGSAAGLVAVVMTVGLGLGWYDRIASGVLISMAIVLVVRTASLPIGIAVAPTVAALALHITTPGAPYGSAAAWGRRNPSGGWRMPAALEHASWAVLSVAHIGVGLLRVWPPDGTWFPGGIEIAAGVALPFNRRRPWVWLVALATVPFATPDVPSFVTAGLILLHLRTARPAWVPPEGNGVDRVFFDGHCGLCHRVVRFLLAEDRTGRTFRLAPLQGPTFDATVPAGRRADLPDAVVLVTADGEILTRSDAVLRIGRRLGGAWRLLAIPGAIVPRPARNAVYDGVARVRSALFPRPGTLCPVVPEPLRERIDP